METGRIIKKKKKKKTPQDKIIWVLFENRPALYFCNYKENDKNNPRILDTLFIDDFVDIMEQYFHH